MIEIIELCHNYNNIVNYNYSKEDYITDNIINMYQNQIFSKEKNVAKIKILDDVVMKYISNKDFHNYIKNYYLKDDNAYFLQSDLKLIELYDKYRVQSAIHRSKWI